MDAGTSQAEVHASEDRRYAAMVAADVSALEQVLADDMIYTHSSSSVDTKASLIELIRSGRSVYRRIERPEEKIRIYGQSAVVTGQARIELGGDSPRTLNLRYTNVWVKNPGGWQMVAWQSTRLPD